MTLLIDTNIVLDYLQKRSTFNFAVDKIFELIEDHKIHGVLAAHSVPNLWYILRKEYTATARREIFISLLDFFEIGAVDKQKLVSALGRGDFPDFEDCLQDECAASAQADFIITRNKKDFAHSKVRALLPEEAVAIL